MSNEENRLRQLFWIKKFFSTLGVVLVVMGLGLIAYTVYSSSLKKPQSQQDNPTTTIVITSDDSYKNSNGKILDGASSNRNLPIVSISRKSYDNQAYMQRTNKWRPTDYKFGDLTKGIYKIQKGDTLWEIAEAVYGDPNQWTKIAEINSAKVKYVNNRAIIEVGDEFIL